MSFPVSTSSPGGSITLLSPADPAGEAADTLTLVRDEEGDRAARRFPHDEGRLR